MGVGSGRSRWAAIGAAVAVTLGAGGIGLVSATSPSGAVTYVPLAETCRVADTRPAPFTKGPRSTPLGAGETHTINVGEGDCSGKVPATATAVQLNVTSSQATEVSFLTLWASGPRPDASSLNPAPGQPATPNAVTTAITGAGDFNVYNNKGTVQVIADIVGYYTDHNHDDRYYTKSQSDDRYVNVGPVVTGQALSKFQPYGQTAANIEYWAGYVDFDDAGSYVINLDSPLQVDGVSYELTEVRYCLITASPTKYIDRVTIWNDGATVSTSDHTNRTAKGCYTVEWEHGHQTGYGVIFTVAGGAPLSVFVSSLQATWVPGPLVSLAALDASGAPPAEGFAADED